MSTGIAQKARSLLNGSSLRARLLRGSAASIAIKAASMLLAFLLSVVLARSLGPDGYGVYGFVLAVVMILVIPAQVGLPQLVVRETAKAHGTENWELMRGLWRWANQYVAAFSVLMISMGLLALWLVGDWLGEARRITFTIGLPLIPLVALGNLRGAAVRGLGNVVLGQLPESVLRPMLTLAIFVLAVSATQHVSPSPAVAMGSHVSAAFLAFAIGATLLLRVRPSGVKSCGIPIYQARYWRKAATPLAMLAGFQLINHHTDIIMLGLFRTDEEVGVYRVVVQVATLVVFGLQAFNLVLQPHFARLHSQGDMLRLQRLVTYSARVILTIAIPPVLIMVFAGGALLELVFGGEYKLGALALSILAFGQLINAGMGSVGMLLNMTGHESDAARGVAIGAISNVVLNLLLIALYGMEGAALATAITLLIWNLILRSYARNRLGIETSALGILGRS